MKFTSELNEETGKPVVRWEAGEHGGYCATPEDAANDSGRFDAGPCPHPERRQLSGCQQYKARVICNGRTSATEYSDWFPTDAGAAAGFWLIMAEQGYTVRSVEIAFPLSTVVCES